MSEFISESIFPTGDQFDSGAMSRGEPGLPRAFSWRNNQYAVASVVRQWKGTSAEGGRAGGEVYLRRHYFELRMSDGSVWTIYFVRQTPKCGSAKLRWYVYTVDQIDAP